MWNEMGELQLKFLIEQGLQPEHYFLDVGCGSLRAGVKVIPYLEPGRYFGVDQEQSLLTAGRMELGEELWQKHQPTLMPMDDFRVGELGQQFDFAVAQSVWSHISLNLIMRCAYNVDKVLVPGGVFFATIFVNPFGRQHTDSIQRVGGTFQTNYDRDPFHYAVDTMAWVAEGTSLEFEYIGEWGHPREQQMLKFTKRA